MKFLADGMLGKLTRWLRMLGQDVIYSTQLSDNQLLVFAKAEDRALLTRDFELYKHATSRCLEAFYVDADTEPDRLAQVSKRFGLQLNIDMDKSRCPVCNTKLQATDKESIRGQLEPNTYRYYDRFWRCPNCGQVYWQGAHWKQITNTLTHANQKMSSNNERKPTSRNRLKKTLN